MDCFCKFCLLVQTSSLHSRGWQVRHTLSSSSKRHIRPPAFGIFLGRSFWIDSHLYHYSPRRHCRLFVVKVALDLLTSAISRIAAIRDGSCKSDFRSSSHRRHAFTSNRLIHLHVLKAGLAIPGSSWANLPLAPCFAIQLIGKSEIRCSHASSQPFRTLLNIVRKLILVLYQRYVNIRSGGRFRLCNLFTCWWTDWFDNRRTDEYRIIPINLNGSFSILRH